MRKSRFTEEQMVRIVGESDKATVAEVAKKHGISGETLYQWRRKFGGMNAHDAKRLKALEFESGTAGTSPPLVPNRVPGSQRIFH